MCKCVSVEVSMPVWEVAGDPGLALGQRSGRGLSGLVYTGLHGQEHPGVSVRNEGTGWACEPRASVPLVWKERDRRSGRRRQWPAQLPEGEVQGATAHLAVTCWEQGKHP